MCHTVWSPGVFLVCVVSFVVVGLSGTVESGVIASCSFENDTSPLCGWPRTLWSDGDWERSSGSFKGGTGPSYAERTVGGRYFIYLNSTKFKASDGTVQSGKSVSLMTPELPGISGVVFLYMKYGDDSIGSLLVGLVNNRTIYIEALSGQNELGDIAVDEVHLLDTFPSPNADCLKVLKGTSETTTQTTSVTSLSSVSLKSPTSSSSFTGKDATTAGVKSTTEAFPKLDQDLDLVIIIATVIPVIVLIVAGVVACLVYRHRMAQSRPKPRPPEDVGKTPKPEPEEEYDVIDPPDEVPDHYDTLPDKNVETTDPYCEIIDSPEKNLDFACVGVAHAMETF